MDKVLKAVYNILSNDANVTGITSRIYPIIGAENTVFPFITMRVESTTPHDTKSGPSTVDHYFVDIDCYDIDDGTASGYSTVSDLALYVRSALDRVVPATYEGISVQGSRFIDSEQGFDKQSDVYVITMTFMFRVLRAVSGRYFIHYGRRLQDYHT